MCESPENRSCPFCSISEGTTDYPWILYRDSDTVAFFPDEPATRGHSLVIPRDHVEFFWELSAEQSHAMIDTARRLAVAIRDSLNPDGLNLIQSNGHIAEQSIFHVHLHLLPRYADDGIGPIWPDEQRIARSAKETDLKAILRSIDTH